MIDKIDDWIATRFPKGTFVAVEDMSRLILNKDGVSFSHWYTIEPGIAVVLEASRDGLLLAIGTMYEVYMPWPAWPQRIYPWKPEDKRP